MDPMRSTKREAQRRVNEILKSLQRRQKKTRKIHVTDYEAMIANDIIMPENISVTFDDIGGLEDIKLKLQESVILPLKYPELFRGKLLKVPKGILLYGEPGTGKTMLAKAISKTSEAAFINLNIANIAQKWLGESEKMIHATFTLAQKIQPCIIFVDEADCLFRTRSSSEYEVYDRMKALFMTLWDGLATDEDAQITIIGATNRPWTIDEAIQRRMPQTFHIGMPDQIQRETILKIILKGEDVEPNFDIKKLAEETEGFSGSDLMALCQTAARAPVRDHLGNVGTVSPQMKPMRHLKLQDFLDAKQIVGATGSSANSYWASHSHRTLRTQTQQSQTQRPVTNVFNFNMFPVAQPNQYQP